MKVQQRTISEVHAVITLSRKVVLWVSDYI